MKTLISRIAIALFLVAGIGQSAERRGTSQLNPLTPVPCDESLWSHVYAGIFHTAKDRLQVIDPCKTVTGTIVFAGGEPDADIHIRLKLNPGQESLLNGKNKAPLSSGQGGFLVVEPICQKNPTQADTVKEKVCDGFRQNLRQ